MKKEKKPDHVVYNTETERYDAFLKPYATSLSAPVITTTDSLAWKNRNINKVNKHVQAKYNNLVYGAKFNFEPIVGDIYHLYKRADESIFLSIIAPEECNFNHVNSFYLDADGIWHKQG
jgi:hypothetical protein